jgi:type IV secretion system protein VirB4
VEGFRLSERELEWVRDTHPESRQFLIKHDQDSVIARLDLGDMPDLVRVMSGTVTSVAECEAIRAEAGEDPRAWLPIFCGWGDRAGGLLNAA